MELLRVHSNQNRILEKLQHLLELPQRRNTSGRSTRPRKQAQNRLTADQQAELLKRYLAGERAFELATAYNVNRHTVAKLLTDADLRRPRSLTPDQTAEVIQLYADGWSCERIGQRFGKTHGTIWRALKTAGVVMRDSHGRDRT